MTHRTCLKCGEEKPVENFSPTKGGLHGRRARCKPCCAAENRAHREARRGGPARNRRAPSADGMVTCTKCRKIQPVAEFRPEPRNADGLRSQCKSCDRSFARDWQRSSGQAALWAMENPEAVARNSRKSMLIRKYGMTIDDYEDLLAWQGGGCAICGATTSGVKHWPHLAVDHDHTTGAVRGLLCSSCNTGIGQLGDDPARVFRALLYLTHGRLRQT